eukprot:m.95569 g.95569  ORF g.95569 m.95569 type:complete len:172 (+) comp12439_c1_seq2:91-606(+)
MRECVRVCACVCVDMLRGERGYSWFILKCPFSFLIGSNPFKQNNHTLFSFLHFNSMYQASPAPTTAASTSVMHRNTRIQSPLVRNKTLHRAVKSSSSSSQSSQSQSSKIAEEGKTYLDVVEMAHTKNSIIRKADKDSMLNLYIRQKLFWKHLQHTFDTSDDQAVLVNSTIQ